MITSETNSQYYNREMITIFLALIVGIILQVFMIGNLGILMFLTIIAVELIKIYVMIRNPKRFR